MKERPILFSGEMVCAILDGEKTQTRRVMKPQPPGEDYSRLIVGPYHPTKVDREGFEYPGEESFGAYTDDGEWGWRSPFGKPGDRLWVKETWRLPRIVDPFSPSHIGEHFALGPVPIEYLADGDRIGPWMGSEVGRNRRSLHMPRWASRITLEVTGVRAERLQDISEEDAIAECPLYTEEATNQPGTERSVDVCMFAHAWNLINAKRGYPWASNPWVWVVEFERVVG